MIVLQGVNNEVVYSTCSNDDDDNGCWNCDNCGGSYTH